MQIRCKSCLDIIYVPREGNVTQPCRCENIIVTTEDDRYEFGWINGKSSDHIDVIDDDGIIYTLDQFKALSEPGEA